MAGAYDELREVLVSPLCPTLLQHSLQGGRELGGPQVDQDREAPGPSVRPLPCPARDLCPVPIIRIVRSLHVIVRLFRSHVSPVRPDLITQANLDSATFL